MSKVWVLVCDSAKARLFEAGEGEAPWVLLSETFHESSRSKASDLVGDRAGSRSSEGASVHHNALAPATSPKDVQKEHFAHELGQILGRAMRSSRFREWVLVAPPHFVGLLEEELTPALQKGLLAKVCKDLNHLSGGELKERLRDTVHAPRDGRVARS